MSKLNPGNWWYYFDRQGKSTAKCKAEGCTYSKTLNASLSTFVLSTHLKNHHPRLHKQREDFLSKGKATNKAQLCENPLKRAFEQAFCVPSSSSEISDAILNDKTENLPPKSPIMIALNATSQWSKDGCATISINRAVMEMLATQLLPFNLVDGAGFRKLIEKLQPKYKLPHRNQFSQYELPKSFDVVKRAVIAELDVVDNIALTCDGWTSKDNRHSLISVTGHFLDRKLRPKFLVISAKPIKGRHTADAIVAFIREALNDFTIPEDKISAITRDTENTMKRVSRDLGFESIDCAAHVLQLCIKEGLKNIDEEARLKNLMESVKKFVRKVRKSRTLTDELVELQMKEEIPQTVLIKNVEVRWNSSYKMLERFIKNRSAINLLAIEHLDLPKFNADDWMLLSSIKNVLSPIYEATLLLQSRNTSISVIIPLFKAISFALRKEGDNRFLAIKNVIASAIESRLRQAEEKQILVIATLLDPRFKAVYLDSTRLNQYKDWLICEQEKAQGKNDLCNELLFQKDASGSSAEDIFSQIEKDAEFEQILNSVSSPSPSVLETRQKAEVELNDYLRDLKIKTKADPYLYWEVNSQKWPLLSKVVRKVLSPPATSSESERLFSIAGLISDDLRKSLSPENLAHLLFLHHNLNLSEFSIE